MQLIVAEKPSVARDLARVLGVPPRGKTCFEGERRVITWCVGHLVELEEPAAYDARWKAWRLDALPMIPARFDLRPVKATAAQFRAVRDLLRDRRFREVVNACDAGREGELIFRYVYQLAGARLPVRRLWISSLTDEAIRQGFDALRPGVELDRLADAARCRSEADWLVGLNATRALTVRRRAADGTLYSIGRVQTPTLAILVRREKEIRAFQPEDYWEVRGRFATAGGERFDATWRHERAGRFGSPGPAEAIVVRAGLHGNAGDPLGPVVEQLRKKAMREPPPLLFDLTSLQRTANKRFGLSAARTLQAAQSLYETHKVLTYPRTDSRHLTHDMGAKLPALFRVLAALPEYEPFASSLLRNPPAQTRRVFDDARVQDHHAIVPTGNAVHPEKLDTDERRIFDLVARRFLGAFFPDAEFALTEVSVRVGPGGSSGGGQGAGQAKQAGQEEQADAGDAERGARVPLLTEAPPPPDRFHARGRVRLVAGWQAVAGFGDDAGNRKAPPGGGARDEEETEPPQVLPSLAEGQRLDGTFETLRKRTRPPPRHTEAALLAAMESAGQSIDDEELRLAMKDRGLGTPATRAATIETLLKRGFVARERRQLVPTGTGVKLIDALPVESLASPELTGAWEARLARIARGTETRADFMKEIAQYVQQIVEAIRAATVDPGDRPAPYAGTGASTKNRGTTGRSDGRRAPATGTGKPRPRRDRGRRTDPRTVDVSGLSCPRCRRGSLIAGKRGWGCSQWREGCSFVVWFETAGKVLSRAQLRDLVEHGKTRRGRFLGDAGWAMGRLVLDAAANGGAVRFVEE